MALRRTSPSRAVARAAPLPRAHAASRLVAALAPSGRSLLVAAALVLAGAGLYLGARSTAVFDVRALEVRGASPETAREVRAALASLEGRSLLALDGGGLVHRVEQIPEVAGAEYDRAFPHTLVVFVREEEPAAVLRRGADAWLVAASGRVIRPFARTARSPLARVWVRAGTQIVPGGRIGSQPAAGAIAAVARVPARFPDRVRDVRATVGELTFKLRSGVELRLGDSADLELKLAIATRLLPALLPSGSPAYLDVSVVERPVVGGTLDSEPELEG